MGSAGAVLLRLKWAAHGGVHAEHLEVVPRHRLPDDQLAVRAGTQRHRARSVGDHVREDLVSLSIVDEVGVGNRGLIEELITTLRGVDGDEPLRIG